MWIQVNHLAKLCCLVSVLKHGEWYTLMLCINSVMEHSRRQSLNSFTFA